MLFNSPVFIYLYLPIVLLVFFWLGRWSYRLAATWLFAGSLFFYGWWNPAYVGLLLGSIFFNYGMGLVLAHEAARPEGDKRSWLLALGVGGDLALLGYYKYANFFLDSANTVMGTAWGAGEIILPLGISFFTFTQIAFLVDAWRGIAREFNFIHYGLFVTYFPHLIAGPVLHHKEMMPQYLVVNHAWDGVKQHLGLPTGRHWTRILAWTTTFLAGLVGWVFFRAESLQAALAMLAAMGGANGVALPGDWFAGTHWRIAPLLHSAGIQVGGAGKHVPDPWTWAWIGMLLLMVARMPNTQKIMTNFRPALDYVAEAGRAVPWRFRVNAAWAALTTFLLVPIGALPVTAWRLTPFSIFSWKVAWPNEWRARTWRRTDCWHS